MGMHIENILDSLISCPVDAIIAICQIHDELPMRHGQRRRFRWLPRKSLTVYRGRIDWLNIEFDYVEFEDRLHVLGFWEVSDSNGFRRKADSIFGHAEEEKVRGWLVESDSRVGRGTK
jgi:hypothetical protein